MDDDLTQITLKYRNRIRAVFAPICNISYISRTEHGLYLSYIYSMTLDEFLQNFAFTPPTCHPTLPDFLREWFVRQRDLYKQDEEDGNVCVICYESINKYKRMERCPGCRRDDIHDKCLERQFKFGNLNCPLCRHPLRLLARRRQSLEELFQRGRHYSITILTGPWGEVALLR
jgi:transcription elongation factor Elf1